MKEGQKAIYYMTGDDRARQNSPQLEASRRVVSMLLLTDQSTVLGLDGAFLRGRVQIGDAGHG